MTIRPRPGLQRPFADCLHTNEEFCKRELAGIRSLATAVLMSAIRDFSNPNRMSFQHWLKDEKQPLDADEFLLDENAAGFWLAILEIDYEGIRPVLEELLSDRETLGEMLKGGATKFGSLESQF